MFCLFGSEDLDCTVKLILSEMFLSISGLIGYRRQFLPKKRYAMLTA